MWFISHSISKINSLPDNELVYIEVNMVIPTTPPKARHEAIKVTAEPLFKMLVNIGHCGKLGPT
jgi:hypothetical protein